MPRPAKLPELQEHRKAPIEIQHLKNLARKDLLQLLSQHRDIYREWLRRLILRGHRIDVLCEVVLGYQVQPHHLQLIKHQYANRESMTLMWRGSGKTTIGTIATAIFHLLLNRDRTILFASKTGTNAEDFLKEVKRHFESNEVLREVFGDLVGTEKWGNDQIEVKGRTRPQKEPSINTVGLGGAVASKHYDIIMADDLVDEDNSRTKYQREKMLDWYYKMLIPTLKPPNKDDGFVGKLQISGTRYHYADLYGHLMARQMDGSGGEMEGKTLIVPVDKPDGEPQWPEKFTKEHIQKLKGMGIIRFNTQYRCNADAMKGQIFRYDDCRVVEDNEIPWESLRVYQGYDLMISEDDQADMFAKVTIGRDVQGAIYVLNYYEDQLRFPEQTSYIKDNGRKDKPIRIGIEANAYQAAQIQQLRKEAPDLNVRPIYTLKDKITNALNLSKYFESGQMRFRRDQMPLIEHLVMFPNYRYKDLFDALYIAVQASEARVKKAREEPPVL